MQGREAWAGHDLLSDGRAGQSPPDGRVAARGAAPGLCWLVRAGEGGPRGPPVRGVRPGGPASRGKAVGDRAGKPMTPFEPMARPGGKSSSARGGSLGFALASRFCTESLSRARFQSEKSGRQALLPSRASLSIV